MEHWDFIIQNPKTLKEYYKHIDLTDLNETISCNDEDNNLEVEMNHRIAKVAKEANIDVNIPNNGLVAYSIKNEAGKEIKKYCLAQETDSNVKNLLLSTMNSIKTINTIKAMPPEKQKELARNLSIIIKKAGIVEANFETMGLTHDDK